MDTITIGGADGAGQTYTITINQKTVTFTSIGGGNAANITGLLALLQASTEPEFKEIVWASPSSLVITATARTAGTPFTQASSAVGGTGTLVTAHTTANSSPNDVNNALNWSLGSVPVSTNNVYIDNTNVSLLWNLSALSAVTLASLTISSTFEGQIGLSEQGDGTAGLGNGYEQYRPTYWAISATTTSIGDGVLGIGSNRIKINYGSVQNASTIYNTGTPITQEQDAVILLGTHASNTLTILGGSVGSAVFGGDVSTWLTVRVTAPTSGLSNPPAVRFGAGCTLTTETIESGTLWQAAGTTTLTVSGGQATLTGTAPVTTLNLWQGTVTDQTNSTIGTLTIGSQGVFDRSGQTAAQTITNTVEMYSGSTLLDPTGSLVFGGSPGILPNGCDISELNLQLGRNRGFTPA